MITNALKYAFPQERKGKISINIKKDPNENVCIIFKDDGIGLPRENDNQNQGGLGMQLIETLVNDQLDGSVNLTVDQGTQFNIRFKVANSH